MRSTPALAASPNTVREPSMFSSRVALLALRMAKARCTTTSAPFTSVRTLPASVTSPCVYSVFFQPRSAGSKGRLAMPTIRFTRRERSSASTIATPRSPVGPVTATVSPSVGIGDVSTRSGRVARLAPVLAADQAVERVGRNRVLAVAAAHHVAGAVAHVNGVVAPAGADAVAAGAAGHLVVAPTGTDAVVAGVAAHVHV